MFIHDSTEQKYCCCLPSVTVLAEIRPTQLHRAIAWWTKAYLRSRFFGEKSGVWSLLGTRSYWGLLALLLGARTLLGAPGIATRSILTTSNKKLIGTPGIAPRSILTTSSKKLPVSGVSRLCITLHRTLPVIDDDQIVQHLAVCWLRNLTRHECNVFKPRKTIFF